MKEIRYLRSYAGPKGPAIAAGTKAEVEDDEALRLVRSGGAEAVGWRPPSSDAEAEDPKSKADAASAGEPETAAVEPEAEKAVVRKNGRKRKTAAKGS